MFDLEILHSLPGSVRARFHTISALHTDDSDDKHEVGFGIAKFSSNGLKIAPPTPPGKDPHFYNEEAYSKRLIGNACSIVVLEMLLAPLAKLFSQQQYESFHYSYAWEPNAIGEQARSPKPPPSSRHHDSTSPISHTCRQKVSPDTTPAAKDERKPEMISIGTKFRKVRLIVNFVVVVFVYL